MCSLEAKRCQLRIFFCWAKSARDLALSTGTKKMTIGPFLGVIIIYFRQKTEVKFVQCAVNHPINIFRIYLWNNQTYSHLNLEQPLVAMDILLAQMQGFHYVGFVAFLLRKRRCGIWWVSCVFFSKGCGCPGCN